MDSSEQIWPDETIAILPETPQVRLSPRRRMNPMTTPGWPPAHVGSTIRMYHDPEEEDQTVNFTMNADFIESSILFEDADGRYAIVYSTSVTDEGADVVTFKTG
jgi:hypothetical protein